MGNGLLFQILMCLSYFFIICGSIGMVIIVTKFPFSSNLGDLSLTKDRFLGLNGKQVWILSWILIIAGTVFQLLLYIIGVIHD